MIRAQFYSARAAVVKMRECNLILSANLVPNDYFVDIIEFIPIFILLEDVPIEWLELRTTRNSHIERFSGVKALFVKQIVVIAICKVRKQLVG